MQVSVEKTDNKFERKLRIQIPAERVEKEIRDRLKEVGRRTRLKGFRPGKAPIKVLEKQFGPQVREEVLGELVQSTYSEALVQQRLSPAGHPRIEGARHQPGVPLEFTATFEVMPEVDLGPLDKLVFEREVVAITDADVDKLIEKLRLQRSGWERVDRAAAIGDQVIIDFTGTLDGEVFPGGDGRNVHLVLGEGRFVAGFENELVGAAAKNEREFDLEFPADYPGEHLAGKTARFKVTVHAVSARNLPAVDEAFCAAFGVTEGGVERLRSEVRANMQAELDVVLRRRLKRSALNALLAANPVELPRTRIADEIAQLKADARERMGSKTELSDDLFREHAERRVGIGLLVAEVIRVHGIELDRQRVRAKIEEVAQGFDDPRKAIDAYNKNQRLTGGIEALVMEEQVVDKLLESGKVTDKKATFDEVMNA